jgi:LysM repeat protein
MIKRLFFVFLLLSIQIYNVKSEKAFYPEASFFSQSTDYFLHTIERGQTVFSIAGMYHVSVEDIYSLNPESRDGIKQGYTLKIPQESGSYFYHTIQPKETLYSVSRQYQLKGEDITAVNPGLSIETFTIGKIIRIPTNRVSKSQETNPGQTEALLNPAPGKNINKMKVALLLPFGLNEGATPDNASKNRIVEYYEGFLLALENLKKKNISVQLSVYDIGSGVSLLNPVLNKSELQKVNLLIGGMSDEQIKLISKFSNKYQIPYVFPFTAKSDEPLNNPNVYQINTPQSYLYSKASLEFYNKFKKSNIILYDSKKTSDKSEFIQVIKDDLYAKRVTYRMLNSGSGLSFSDLIDPKKQNVILPSDDSEETLTKIMTELKGIKTAQPETSISLFGYPSWQVYGDEYAADFYRLNVIFYSTFYADPTAPAVKAFEGKFRQWYSRNLINRFPKYGMLGYDTGMFFIQLLHQYGTSYDTHINQLKYEGVQTGFYFERVNNWGGFINTNIYFVEFSPNNKITVKRFNP